MSTGRVGTITYDWYPFDVCVRRLAEAAASAGYSVDVVCIRQGNEAARDTCNGVSIYRMPVVRGFGQSLPLTVLSWCWFMLLAGAKLTREHLRERYDVIHVHNMPDFLVFSALIPKLLGARVILEVQDVSPELMAAKASGRKRDILMRVASWQERMSAAFADHVVTVGWPFEELLRRRGLPERKLSIVLNSADPGIFPPSRRRPLATQPADADHPFVVMYWGTVAERNGLDTAVRALALALPQAPHLRLDIMGRGEYIPVLKRLAEDLGVADRIRFSDPVPAENIVDFVVHGDLGIIPYRLDGFAELVLPTKAYELAWMQIAMIASDTKAIRSMFRPESIVLCDSADPGSFAAAIVDLYRHPEKRQSMVASAAADYEPYRWEAMRARYEKLLGGLRGKRKATRQQSAFGVR